MARLSQRSRDALPDSAFVFPETRSYPIHDRNHAMAALSDSAGKPEHDAVVAAVRKRYPDMQVGGVTYKVRKK